MTVPDYFDGGLKILAFPSLGLFSKVDWFWRVAKNTGAVLSCLICFQVLGFSSSHLRRDFLH